MALFGNKKEETKKDASPEVAKGAATVSAPRDLSSVIIKPRITEKAVAGSEKNVYVFEVHQSATKYDVRDAVKEFFGVTPVKVHTVTQKARQTLSRGRGRTIAVKGLKKAYVYLKEGDSISLV